jgi:ribosomal protein L28
MSENALFPLQRALRSACDKYTTQAIADTFNVKPSTIRSWCKARRVAPRIQELLQLTLEGLEFSSCFWSRELRRLHGAFSMAQGDDAARWRYVNMIAMLLAQWADEYGFNFEIIAHGRRNGPSVLRVWSPNLPEAHLNLRVSETKIMLNVVTASGLKKIHLEPCLVAAVFAELKQEELQTLASKKVDLSADTFDIQYTEDHGSRKTKPRA